MLIKADMPISQEIQKEHALSKITNFIAQEIYRMAVMEHYPYEYDAIKDLSNNIWDKCCSLREQGIDYLLEDLSNTIINNVVFKVDENTFNAKIKELFDDECKCVLALVGSPDTEMVANYSYPENENELKENALKISQEIFSEYRDFSCNIPHKYPPYILSYTFDYEEALTYYHGLFFLYQKEGNTIKIDTPPYLSIRPYALKSISRIKVIKEEIEISKQALSRNSDIVIELVKNESALIPIYVDLDICKQLNPYSSVSYSSKLRCELDTSEPLSEKDVDKFFTYLRSEIASIQRNNRQCKLLMAENLKELINAYNVPKIKSDDLEKIEKLHKIEMPNLETPSHAKNYLLGLILANEHYRNKKNSKGDGLNISDRSDFLSQKLAKDHGEKGFTSAMIQKGYKLVRKSINNHINDFKANYH